MDINEFSTKYSASPALRTTFSAALAQKLAEKGLTSTDVNLSSSASGNTVITGKESDDQLIKLRAAHAAIEVLKDSGVTDLNGINPLDPLDPLGVNIVYKDGGWIVNL